MLTTKAHSTHLINSINCRSSEKPFHILAPCVINDGWRKGRTWKFMKREELEKLSREITSSESKWQKFGSKLSVEQIVPKHFDLRHQKKAISCRRARNFGEEKATLTPAELSVFCFGRKLFDMYIVRPAVSIWQHSGNLRDLWLKGRVKASSYLGWSQI